MASTMAGTRQNWKVLKPNCLFRGDYLIDIRALLGDSNQYDWVIDVPENESDPETLRFPGTLRSSDDSLIRQFLTIGSIDHFTLTFDSSATSPAKIQSSCHIHFFAWETPCSICKLGMEKSCLRHTAWKLMMLSWLRKSRQECMYIWSTFFF